MLMVILEKVLEAIYFSLFLIYGKRLKNKRLVFIGLMIFQYLVLTTAFQYNIWIHILYTFLTYLNLKIIYNNKAQVTDIFLFASASIILIIVGAICVLTRYIIHGSYIEVLILNRILLFTILFLIRNKINIIYTRFYKRWNRHKDTTKIKSLTLRNISIIVFNLMFYIINIGLTYIVLVKVR